MNIPRLLVATVLYTLNQYREFDLWWGRLLPETKLGIIEILEAEVGLALSDLGAGYAVNFALPWLENEHRKALDGSRDRGFIEDE